MIIGSFRETATGYTGHISTLALDAMVVIVPAAPSDAENAPSWRLLLGDADSGTEIGAGWDRSGERAGSYIAIQIDDPALPLPLRANLVRDTRNDGEHQLLWSRSTRREHA